MDVSPSLRIEDPGFDVDSAKFLDIVDLPSLTSAEFSNIDDFSDHRTSHNDGELLGLGWTGQPSFDGLQTQTQLPPMYREADNTSDKMWGGGGGGGGGGLITDAGKALKNDAGVFYNTFCKNEPLEQPSEPEQDILFNAIFSENPADILSTHNHRSPGSDCVSHISASAYSDSGISNSPDDHASPGHHEHFDLDNMVATAIDSMYCTQSEDGTSLDHVNGGYPPPYMSSVSQDGTTILEGALRGTVRRGTNSLPTPQKTLTMMTNMAPLPSINTAFRNESLGLPPSQPQISSTNGMYGSYEYVPAPVEAYSPVNSPVKISPAASTTTTQEAKIRKRKYTKRGTSEEATSKGRLLHFCNVCSKGFKDKYSVNVHLRTHTGEKPFDCTQCGKCFRQKAHLAKHVQIHASGQKPPGKR